MIITSKSSQVNRFYVILSKHISDNIINLAEVECFVKPAPIWDMVMYNICSVACFQACKYCPTL